MNIKQMSCKKPENYANLAILCENYVYQENPRNLRETYNNYKNLRILSENHENHENLRNSCQNQENLGNPIILHENN